jgi:hypothetical protein
MGKSRRNLKKVLTKAIKLFKIYIATSQSGVAIMVDVAQLVRALVCGTRGRGFESHLPPHYLFIHWGVAKW